MNAIGIAAALICLFNSGLACSGTMGIEESKVPNDPYNLYVGAGIGGAYNSHDLFVLHTNNGTTVEGDFNHTHAIGNVFAGFGFRANNGFYIGGELGTNFPRRRNSFARQGVNPPTVFVNDYLSLQDYLTGDVLSGFNCNNFLIYGRLGLAYSQLSFHQDPTALSPVFDNSSNQLSERLGVGLRYSCASHFSVGADYIYMDYQSWDLFFPGFPVIAKDKPHTNYWGLSLIYTV